MSRYLLALIFMSDATHLSNYAGDKKEWPIYMTVGNLSSELRQKPIVKRACKSKQPADRASQETQGRGRAQGGEFDTHSETAGIQ